MITGLTISQSNITEDCNLLAVHNPLSFFIDADYTSTAPNKLAVEIWDTTQKLGTFNCIPYEDVSSNVRRFLFIADELLRSYMQSYEDYFSVVDVCEHVSNATFEFTLKFIDGEISTEVSFVACHASRQIGQDALMTDVADNSDELFIGAFGMPVYAYFYNDDPNAVITVGQQVTEEVIAVDDDEAYFTDEDGAIFTILVDSTIIEEPEPEPEPIQPTMVKQYKFAMTGNIEQEIIALNGDYTLTINHGRNTRIISPVWFDNNGFVREVSDLFQISDSNNIVLYCNNEIEGVHILQLTFN